MKHVMIILGVMAFMIGAISIGTWTLGTMMEAGNEEVSETIDKEETISDVYEGMNNMKVDGTYTYLHANESDHLQKWADIEDELTMYTEKIEKVAMNEQDDQMKRELSDFVKTLRNAKDSRDSDRLDDSYGIIAHIHNGRSNDEPEKKKDNQEDFTSEDLIFTGEEIADTHHELNSITGYGRLSMYHEDSTDRFETNWINASERLTTYVERMEEVAGNEDQADLKQDAFNFVKVTRYAMEKKDQTALKYAHRIIHDLDVGYNGYDGEVFGATHYTGKKSSDLERITEIAGQYDEENEG